jgi:glycosyltransferase involved in cell wall biosynthesis
VSAADVSADPDVSVVVPTHNRRDLLTATLRTIVLQRDVDLEVIVVDDGSRDSGMAAQAIAEVADDRVVLVRNPVPRGVSAARNRGIATARGVWVAFCDDDDLWAPDKLALQLAAAGDSGRRWVYAGAVKVDLEQRVIGGLPPLPPEQALARLPHVNPIPGGCSGVLVSAAALGETGGFDTRLVNLADWDLWMRLAAIGPPAFVPQPLVAYRIHPRNASADANLILAEARLVDGRYGSRIDYGALYHYLAWVHLRSGRGRSSLRYYALAAAHGTLRAPAADLWWKLRQRIGVRGLDLLGERRRRAQRAEWRAAAQAWLGKFGQPGSAGHPAEPGTAAGGGGTLASPSSGERRAAGEGHDRSGDLEVT